MSLPEYTKIEWIIVVVGVVAILLTLIVHFTSWSETNVRTSSTVPLPLASPEFFRTVESIGGASMKPLSPGMVKILRNGEEFAPDFLKEIAKAERSVTVANYIFKDGDFSKAVTDALIERAKAGVEVRLLIDGKGGMNKPDEKTQELIDAGGKIETFRPLSPLKLTRVNKRSHVRAIVVDGEIGYTGGLAFEDGWLSDGTEGEGKWRDLMFKFTGSGARDLQDVFNRLWRQTSGEILSGPAFYPSVQNNDKSTTCSSSCYISLLHAPTPDLEKDLSQLLWVSVMAAKERIYIESPYFLPDENLLYALKQKAGEGVDVEIVVPGPYVDSKIVQAASRSYYGEILSSGIKVYEYQTSNFHSKIVTIDGQWSIVGSANLDNRSTTLNVENIMAIKDEALARGLEEEFALDRSRAKEITLKEFQTNLFTRAFGRVSRLFAKQY